MRRGDPRPEANVRSAAATRPRSRQCRSRSRSPDEARDAIARLFDLLEARRVTRAHMPLPALAERASRHRNDLLVEQQTLRELLVVHSRGRDVREAVEGAT